MLCKLYVIKYKPGVEKDEEDYRFYEKIYQENGVRVVGLWENVEDSNELYYMTEFRDQAHYDEFVSKMKDNEEYNTRGQKLADQRESIKAITLNKLDYSP